MAVWLYLQTFCKRGQGLIDGLGSCWTPDSQFGFCPTRNTNQPLFILRHILTTAKNKNWCSLLFWTSLLPTTVFQERNFGDTQRYLQKIHSTIFERYHPNHVHRMPLPSYWWRQNFRGGCAQQRLETGLPSESPSVFPLYQWHWQSLDRAERCCHCLGFSSLLEPTLLEPIRSLIVIMLMTLLSLQTQLNV